CANRQEPWRRASQAPNAAPDAGPGIADACGARPCAAAVFVALISSEWGPFQHRNMLRYRFQPQVSMTAGVAFNSNESAGVLGLSWPTRASFAIRRCPRAPYPVPEPFSRRRRPEPC